VIKKAGNITVVVLTQTHLEILMKKEDIALILLTEVPHGVTKMKGNTEITTQKIGRSPHQLPYKQKSKRKQLDLQKPEYLLEYS